MGIDTLDCDFLVLGTGAAGLYAAWQAAEHGRVILVTDGVLASGSSYWAQGGIAAVTTADDSFAAHIADTLAAGRGLCDPAAVEILVREGAAIVQDLIRLGMPFDTDADGRFRRGLEGGHSQHRVLHALGVQTGKALVDFLCDRLARCPSVTVIERAFVHELQADAHGHCVGATVYRSASNDNLSIHALATVLATGGYSALFRRTTNPPGAVGIGMVLAQAAGTRLTDLEFVQFHPTAFHEPNGHTFLISEALRGAGATLVNQAGERFLADTPQAELAPRDAVAAAIAAEIASQNTPYVGLDLRHLDQRALADNFGFIMDAIAAHGIDPARTPVPVAPAAHYCIGGVATDLDGATAVPGLYAAGEVAATGVHGANRLASNSLLECLVFAGRAVTHAAAHAQEQVAGRARPQPLFRDARRAQAFGARRHRLGSLMTREVGLARDRAGLEAARAAIEAASAEALGDPAEHEYFAVCDRHIHSLAYQVVAAALTRSVSVGVHRRCDTLPDQAAVGRSALPAQSQLMS